jgi:hypothetical protein
MMTQRNITYLSFVVAAVFLAGYIYVYQFEPFSEGWNNILVYLADPISSLLAAIGVTAVLTCYTRNDKPYAVWCFFALGLWFWVAAESYYSYVSYVSGEAPSVGVADGVWFIGYGLVSLAMYYQYQVIQKVKNGILKLIGIWALLILLTPVLLLVIGMEVNTDNVVAYLYPVMDFAICLVSFRIYMVFGGGKLSRPWIGLLVLGISDALWAALVAYQPDQSSIISDASYVAAYLILAIGFLRQFLLMRLGPE